MMYLDKYGNRTDDIQDARDETAQEYTTKIEANLNRYIADDDYLNDAIINDADALLALRLMYRAYAEHNTIGVNKSAAAFLLSVDRMLNDMAERDV